MSIYQLGNDQPQIDPQSWVADEATLIGKAHLAANASVWPGAVIRADNEPVVFRRLCHRPPLLMELWR